MATPAQRLPQYRHTLIRTPDWANALHVYRPRRPTATPLYPVVHHHLETNFLLALITLGEGRHNNHHHYQSSTRQGFRWW